METAQPGPLGGAAGETGSYYRACVAAWLVANGLAGRALPGIQLDGSVPAAVDLETDLPVDDIAVQLEPRGLLQIQAKESLGMDETFARVVAQWREAGKHGIDAVDHRLLLVVERPSSTITKLGEALDRKRSP